MPENIHGDREENFNSHGNLAYYPTIFKEPEKNSHQPRGYGAHVSQGSMEQPCLSLLCAPTPLRKSSLLLLPSLLLCCLWEVSVGLLLLLLLMSLLKLLCYGLLRSPQIL